MSLFRCPICGAPLTRDTRAYHCPNRHSYDLAREGYTHLLPANRMHAKVPGDDKSMASARRTFLEKGYYAPLRTTLCELAVSLSGAAPRVLDCGCGEGYYTAGLYDTLISAGKTPEMAGIDISKYILRLAAKRPQPVEYAVSSSYHLPIADNAIDLLLNCFSPLALEEFQRVLVPGGHFLYVVPSADHLWGLKQALYDQPYPNDIKETPYEGFRYVTIRHVASMIHLDTQEDIHARFQMTP